MLLSTYVPNNQLAIKEKIQSYASQTLQIIGGSLFIALCSQIKIVLPFTIVPLTLQTLAVLFLGGLFGSKKGALMVLTYLAEIVLGMPVLAGGAVNSLALIGPKAGYIIGFVFQAYWMGWVAERMENFNSKTLLLAGLTACFLELSLGTCWLAQFVGWNAVGMMGFYPFVPGEILKVLIVVGLLKRYHVVKVP
jgi:biotin transport system substrate-specific component